MAPYVGEIRMFAGNFAPAGWMLCQGQLLAISDNDTLFNLIGTTYGGDGQTTFALPDLQGRIPMHVGNGHVLAEQGGVEEVILTTSQTPVHTHPLMASANQGSQSSPVNNMLADGQGATMYIEQVPATPMAPNSLATDGGSQPHNNLQPYVCINFIISMFGVFPTQ
jgi:microcystin-dependent protein